MNGDFKSLPAQSFGVRHNFNNYYLIPRNANNLAMNIKNIFFLSMIATNSFSQVDQNKCLVDSIKQIQPLTYNIEQIIFQSKRNVYPIFTPDTVITKAKVLKIEKQKYGFLIDIMDVNNSNYYKIVSWCNSCNKRNRIMKGQVYNFTIWEGAPRQIGDFVFFDKWVEKNGKKIKLKYRVKNIRMSTYYYTKNLNGKAYIHDS
jgi:hypothetical protein